MPKRKVDVKNQANESEEQSISKPQITAEERSKLFAAYDAADAAWEAAKKKVEVMAERRQAALAEIWDKSGPGTYNRKGRSLILQKRENTYFFKGEAKTEAIQVD